MNEGIKRLPDGSQSLFGEGQTVFHQTANKGPGKILSVDFRGRCWVYIVAFQNCQGLFAEYELSATNRFDH